MQPEAQIKEEKSGSTSRLRGMLAATGGAIAGGVAAVYKISDYAKEKFAKLGYFNELEHDLVRKVKSASDSQIIHAITHSDTDGEGAWLPRGIFEDVHNEYEHGVDAIFKKHGADSLRGKWEKVLEQGEKNKTLQYAAIATIGVGALLYMLLPSQSKNDDVSTDAADGQYADRVLQERSVSPAKTI